MHTMPAPASTAASVIRRTAYVLAAAMLLAFVSVPAAFAQSAARQVERSLVQEAPAHLEADAAERLPARSYLALRMQMLYPIRAPAASRRLDGAAGAPFTLDAAAEDGGSRGAWLVVGGLAVLGVTAAVLLIGGGGGEGGGGGGEGGGIPPPPGRP